MTLVLDASVVVKWFVAEDDSAAARSLLRGGQALVAPDLVAAELASALRREVARGTIPPSSANRMLLDAIGFFERLVPTLDLIARGLSIAVEVNHAVYDCVYLALAERTGHPLLTADATFARKLAGTRWGGLARVLGVDDPP